MSTAPGNDARRVLAGIDVGGTKIAAGLMEHPGGRILAHRRIPTPAREAGASILDAVEALALGLVREAGLDGGSLAALGVGLCELVDLQGRARSSNCVAWEGLPVSERLGRIARFRLDADVRAAAYAEARFGAGRRFRQFLYVTVGTGISACLVLDGRPYEGARGATGTFASSPLPLPPGSRAGPVARTLEDVAAGPGLVARHRELGGGSTTGPEVLAAAGAGESAAVAVVTEGATALGEAIGGLVNLVDPGAVVLGGGLGLAGGLYRDVLVSAARRQVWWDGHRAIPIVGAETGPDAGWIGAAAAAWELGPQPGGPPESNDPPGPNPGAPAGR